MLPLIEVGARYVRAFIELCVLVGILLLLYFLAEVIEFFPPSLTLGDAAKLALVSIVAASVHLVVVLSDLGVASVGLLVLFFVMKWAVLMASGERHFTKDIDWYFSKLWSAGFLQFPVVGLILIWSTVFGLLPVSRFISHPWVLVSCGLAFYLMSAAYFLRPQDFVLSNGKKADGTFLKSTAVQLFLFGAAIALVAPVFVWGSLDTFVTMTMTKSGLVQVPANVFIQQEYCGLVKSGFGVQVVRDGFCYLEDVAVMFQGIGDKVLVKNFDNGFRVTLPADGVFLSSNQ
jgi:hypothetical protein